MRLLDTVVIIGSLNPNYSMHTRCVFHMNRVNSEPDVFVPAVSILEADLVMKSRGYEYDERRNSWHALEYKIPTSKIISNSVSSINVALTLQEQGMDYFDSLIASTAAEHRASVITTDRVIRRIAETEW